MSGKKRASAPWVDPEDAPDLSQMDIARGTWRVADRLLAPEEGLATMKAATRGRPKAEVTKQAVKLRLDADLLAALRATGDGWQTRINDTLRASMHLAGKV